MNYEQKYKEALARARDMMSYREVRRENMEYLFPELKESDDARIRKAILEHIQLCSESIPDRDKWIAWLEKQGKQSSNILWHEVSEEPEVQREIFCEWKSSTGTWHSIVFYHPYSKSFCEGERIVKNVLKWTYVNEMLEKHDTDFSAFNEEDEKVRKEIKQHFLHLDDSFPDKAKWLAWLEKQNEDSQVTLPPFTFDDILALQCCMETAKKVQEDNDLYEKLKDLHSRLYDAYHLGKQAKQKSVWHDDSDEPIRGSLILLIMQSGTPVVAKITEPNHTFNHGERWAYIDNLIKL